VTDCFILKYQGVNYGIVFVGYSATTSLH